MKTLQVVFDGMNDCIDRVEVMELMAEGLDARYSKDSYIVGYVVRELRKHMDKVRADLLRLDAELQQR